MTDKRNKFICFGAVHFDHILQLKSKYYNNRTNPIYYRDQLGGVAYNISSKLAYLKVKSELISLNIQNIKKNKIFKSKIKFTAINNKYFDRSYTSILNSKGKMILGLANMNNYEKKFSLKKLRNYKNTKIILDLNFSKKNINSIITKYSSNNQIYVCGTSAHKVYKIKHLLSKINFLFLNQKEANKLSNKKSINNSMKYLIKKNKNLTIVISNGKNKAIAYNNRILYYSNPPKINTVNENGAGDAMSATIIYLLNKNLNFEESFAKGLIAGSLKAAGFKSNLTIFLRKINQLVKKVKVTSKKYNG